MFRLLTTLLGSLALTAFVPASSAVTPANSAASAPSADLARRLLELHNRERALAGATPLEWDAGLAGAAADYGAALARAGRLTPSPLARRPRQGENLSIGPHGTSSVEQMVERWVAEKRLFKPGYFPDVSQTGEWRDVAHYTQMIWPGTSRVGCAVATAPAGDVLVCYYAPTGNVVGQMIL